MDERFQTIVIGGGQAGLAAGHYLAAQGEIFIILDEALRTGDSWRKRWDSLRLFTPSKYDSLPGMRFSRPDFYFPTKDEIADYLEAYVGHFRLPVRNGVKVERLSQDDQGYQVSTGTGNYFTRKVIVATGPYQKPYTPSFAQQLGANILQLHSSSYCSPQQVPVQNVLVVGAGNSGAEIALELARAGKNVWLSGKDVGRIPADKLGQIFGGRLYWWIISWVLSTRTPIGRKMRVNVHKHGAPLIRASRAEISTAGIQSTPRVSGVQAGQPRLEDGRSLPVEGVIWATGYRPDYSWIDLPIFDELGYPRHQRGVVMEAPGLYFVGLIFQSALSSAILGGVGVEAKYIVQRAIRQGG